MMASLARSVRLTVGVPSRIRLLKKNGASNALLKPRLVPLHVSLRHHNVSFCQIVVRSSVVVNLPGVQVVVVESRRHPPLGRLLLAIHTGP